VAANRDLAEPPAVRLLPRSPVGGREVPSGFRQKNAVVYRLSQFLLAPEVALRRLNRDMPEQELDLFQFSSGEMTQAGAGPAKVMRREGCYSSAPGGSLQYSHGNTVASGVAGGLKR
jgi:hypothetical protein